MNNKEFLAEKGFEQVNDRFLNIWTHETLGTFLWAKHGTLPSGEGTKLRVLYNGGVVGRYHYEDAPNIESLYNDVIGVFTFKGENYTQDCGIYVSTTMDEFASTARLLQMGVIIEIPKKRVEEIRNKLQEELGHNVRVFTPPVE